MLEKQLEEYRRAIEQLFAQHLDRDLFGSLHGAGAKLAPRLLLEIGSDLEQYPDAQGLQCVAGTGPVSFERGKIRRAEIRCIANGTCATQCICRPIAAESFVFGPGPITRRNEIMVRAMPVRCALLGNDG